MIHKNRDHLIAECPACPRQYRVGDRAPGEKFHCHCGAVVTVPKPRKGHQARVVRCSSCGAPREKGAVSCVACGSDFTLHEQDLHTVCPQCTARISDAAKFCHHCGVEIRPESAKATASELPCPVCLPSRRLRGRKMGEFAFLECDRCAGMWLDPHTFKKLVRGATEEGRSAVLTDFFPEVRLRPDVKAAMSASPKAFYQKCPQCQKIMGRRNFGQASAVLIDACPEHGVWFGCNELARILRWIRDGGLSRAESVVAQRQREEADRAQIQSGLSGKSAGGNVTAPASGSGFLSAVGEALGEIFDGVSEGLEWDFFDDLFDD